jgi:hypothetical protein
MSEIGTGLQNATGIRGAIARAGYAFVEASDMRTALGRFGTLADWPAFAESWNDLRGRHLHGRWRPLPPPPLRVWSAGARADRAAPHQPHYQSLDYNTLNGGIERWFEPIKPEIGDGAACAPSSNIAARCSRGSRPRPALAHRGHQFRIEARPASRASRRPRACTATASTTCWCC